MLRLKNVRRRLKIILFQKSLSTATLFKRPIDFSTAFRMVSRLHNCYVSWTSYDYVDLNFGIMHET